MSLLFENILEVEHEAKKRIKGSRSKIIICILEAYHNTQMWFLVIMGAKSHVKSNHSCSSGRFSKVFWCSFIIFKRKLGCGGHESRISFTVSCSSSPCCWGQHGVLVAPAHHLCGSTPCTSLQIWWFGALQELSGVTHLLQRVFIGCLS